MPSLDVFKADAFSMNSLTAAINKLPYKPSLLKTLGLFDQQMVTTHDVWVEERNNKLALLPISAPGAVNAIRSAPQRQARNFRVPHVPQEQTVMAYDIAGMRAFGSESELEAVTPYVNDQLQGMKDNHDVTHEWHRFGALKGSILDSDGTTEIYNLFTEFGLTQVEIDFEYAIPDFGYLLTIIIQRIAEKLGGTPFGQIFCIAGNEYFASAKGHTSVTTAYERWRDGEHLRISALGPEWYSIAANGFMFNDVMFINYRGQIGDVRFLEDDEAYYFASGVPGLFSEIYAPAYFMETVNTRAVPMYARQEMLKHNIGVELHTESNMLAMCTRPSSVIKSTVTNFTGTSTAT